LRRRAASSFVTSVSPKNSCQKRTWRVSMGDERVEDRPQAGRPDLAERPVEREVEDLVEDEAAAEPRVGNGRRHRRYSLPPLFCQSSRNFLSPMSVSGCFMSCCSTLNGIVAT